MRDQQVNTFYNGLMKDFGVTIPQEGSYTEGYNIRIVSDGDKEESGVVVSVDGNERKVVLGRLAIINSPEDPSGPYDEGRRKVSRDPSPFNFNPDEYIVGDYFSEGHTVVDDVDPIGGGITIDVEDNYLDPNPGGHELQDPEFEPIGYTGVTITDIENLVLETLNNLQESLAELLNLADSIVAVTPIGYTFIKNKLIIFGVSDCAANEWIADEDCVSSTCRCIGTVGSIHEIDLDNNYTQRIIYQSKNLNFSSGNYIQAIGRYESESIQRIYWTDNLNPVRTLNVADDNLFRLPTEELELGIPVSFSTPTIERIDNTGELPAGMYQYAYRLKTAEGAVSRFSPLSNFTHVVPGNAYWYYEEDPENQQEYNGGTPGESTDKAVHIRLSNIDLDYEFLELVTIYKTTAGSINRAYIVKEVRIDSNKFDLIHLNDSGAELTAEEVTAISSIPHKVRTVATKDNRLFLGGVEYSTFDLEFNARAYRYRRPDNQKYPHLSLTDSPNMGNSEMITYADPEFDPITKEGSSVYTAQHNLDAINPYNNFSQDNFDLPGSMHFKFKKNGVTLGGEGAINPETGQPIIEYEFFKKIISGNDSYDIPTEAPFVSTPFKGEETKWTPGDYKSPENVSKFVGYHRDEIYRFGIVLYDLQGNPGFVNWIGDIRFPSYEDFDHKYTGGIYNYTLAQVYSSTPGVGGYPGTGSGTNYNLKPDVVDVYQTGHTFYEDLVNIENYNVVSSYDNNNSNYNHSAGGYLYALGIMFKVDLPKDIKEKISGYRIVRLERKQADKTVLGTGLVNYLSENLSIFGGPNSYQLYTAFGSRDSAYTNNTDIPLAYGVSSGDMTGGGEGIGQYIQQSLTIDSPDFAFGTYPTTSSNWLHMIGAVTGKRKNNFQNNDVANTNKSQATVFSAHKLAMSKIRLRLTHDIEFLSKLERGGNIPNVPNWTLKPESDFLDVNYLGVFNHLTSNSNDETIPDFTRGMGEETLFVRIKDPASSFINGLEYTTYTRPDADSGKNGTLKMLGAIRTSSENMYGGRTEIDRRRNIYIPAGPFINVESDPLIDQYGRHEVWGGDTYVVLYDLEKIKMRGGDNDTLAGGTNSTFSASQITDDSSNTAASVSYAFPVESSFNTTLRTGWHFANKTNFKANTETPLNTFELPNCYSSPNVTESFIMKPLGFKDDVPKFNSRILYSDAKINGESLDSWRKFKLENYRDLEGLYGDLNKLLVYNDKMYFLQDTAFGGLSISPVSTVIDDAGTSIVLGTGEVIQDSNYISTSVGCTNPFSVITSEKGIYWVDFNKKKAYAFRSNGLESISDVHGMKSWFNDNMIKDEVVLGYDYINSEVLFSMGRNSDTGVYSEVLNKFTSIYSYSTPLFISGINQLLSAGNSNKLFRHNAKNKYQWYDAPHYTSEIEFIVNKNPLHSKIYDTLEWYLPDGALTKIEYSTSYVDSVPTGVVQDDGSLTQNVYLREQIYRSPIPRDVTKGRLRDTYLKVKMTFSNSTSGFKKVLLHYVKTLFRISRR